MARGNRPSYVLYWIIPINCCSLITPLIHDGEIGGFMGLDFCNASAEEVATRCLADLCKASTRVSSMLEAKRKL